MSHRDGAAKLTRLRIQVGRCKGLGPIFKKLRSSDLEKALTFLDDRLLGSTSNAVERGNRRHRKMQKTVYRVRTRATISGRIALDMFRDAQGPSRTETMKTLHHARRRYFPALVLKSLKSPSFFANIVQDDQLSLDGPQVPFRRPPDCRLAILLDHHLPECPVNPVELERFHGPHDALDGRGW